MLKKYSILTLIVLLLNLTLTSSAFAGTKEEKEARFAEKVKTNVAKLGTGKDARVEVRLKDGTRLKGYISQANENGFVVINDRTATPTEVGYAQTKQVKGNNLSNRVKFAISIGLVAFFIAIIYFAGRSG